MKVNKDYLSNMFKSGDARKFSMADVLAVVLAFVFLGEAFVAGFLIKSKKLFLAVLAIMTIVVIGGTLYAHSIDITDMIDPQAEGFLFGSTMVGTVAAKGFSYPVRFIAGYLAGMAWRSRFGGKNVFNLCAASMVVYTIGMAPLEYTISKLDQSMARTTAKLEFYSEMSRALREAKAKHPEIDQAPLLKVLSDQVKSVSPHYPDDVTPAAK